MVARPDAEVLALGLRAAKRMPGKPARLSLTSPHSTLRRQTHHKLQQNAAGFMAAHTHDTQ